MSSVKVVKMSRKEEVKSRLTQEFTKYKVENPNTIGMNLACPDSLSKLMDEVFLKVEINNRKTRATTLYLNLRRSLADYLLLLDDFDIKEVSQTSEKQHGSEKVPI